MISANLHLVLGFSLTSIWNVLKAILCVLQQIGPTMLAILILALNAVIAGLATILATMIALLPEMPEWDGLPAPFVTASEWINWVFPVDTLLGFMAFAITAWVIWQAVVIVLRWAKAVDG